MVDRDDLVELAPHYVAMLLLTFVALGIVRSILPGLGTLQEFVVIVVIVFLYRPAVQRLGLGPSAWEPESDTVAETEAEAEPDAEAEADPE